MQGVNENVRYMSDHEKRHLRKWIVEILEETPKGDNYVLRWIMVHKQGVI